MRSFFRRYGDVIQVIIGVFVAASAGADMVGKPVRLVQLVALTAGVFGAGLGAGAAIAKRRSGRGPN